MSYFKVDDILLSHWRARVAGPAGVGVWTMGGIYCVTQMTDGHIPHVVAKTLLPYGTTIAIKKVLESGLWISCNEHEQCYVMRAYHSDSSGSERQPTKAEVERRRKLAREKKSRQRRNELGQYDDGTPPIEDGERPGGVPDVSRGDTADVPPSYSTPLHSEGAIAPSADAAKREPEKPLPADWAPTKAHIDLARERHVDLLAEADAFRLHAETHDRRAARWNAAFTTWLKKAKPTRGTGGNDDWMWQ